MARGLRWIDVAVAVLVCGFAPVPALAGPLEPASFTPLGSLSLLSGSYTVDTTGGTPTLVVGGTTYRGVISSGGVAVFDFSSITIATGVTLTAVKGAGHPVAFLSQSDATINGRIDVSAFSSSAGAGAGNTGVGGNGSFTTRAGAGGGGFGGAGGAGGNFNGPGGAGGAASGPPLIGLLQGGSSGGTLLGSGSGGGGGGAIEIGAIGSLKVGGEIDAIGGDGFSGGGGSGGGIYLHASNVLISGSLIAQGGLGDPGAQGPGAYAASGAGGGGKIEVDYSPTGAYTAGTMNVNGGAQGFNGSQAGAAGKTLILANYTPTAVPEPSSLVLLGTSTLGLLGAAAFRRSRAA